MPVDFEIHRLLPELIISFMACVILIVDQTKLKEIRGWSLPYILASATLLGIAIALPGNFSLDSAVVLNGMYVDDLLSRLIKFAICLLTLFVFVYSYSYSNSRGLRKGEYYVLGLLGVVGMMTMASAGHLLVLYLGLELMSLCLYAMVAFQRDSAQATEAAMKYFVLGAIASGCLLYGMSILYGITGSLHISAVQEAVSGMSLDNAALIFALVFVIVALAFKLGAAPFHMWVPDVYHGSPTSTTLYLGTAPKIAAFALVMRLLVDGLDNLQPVWQDMLIVIALLSIVVGNVIAISQTNLKRMLAYSTIAHMGYMLLGILSGSQEGYAASLFYILVYSTMSLGAFGIIALSARKDSESDLIEDFSGLNSRNPWLAFLMLLLMFSLAGVPPTVGFYAKLSVIQALIGAGLVWVAVVAVIFAVVGAYYYLRVIKVMYFDELTDERKPFDAANNTKILLAINAIGVVAILPWVGNLLEICSSAIAGLY